MSDTKVLRVTCIVPAELEIDELTRRLELIAAATQEVEEFVVEEGTPGWCLRWNLRRGMLPVPE